MSTGKNSLCNAIEIINTTTDLFYQQKKEEGFKLLDKLFENIIYAVDEIFNCDSIEGKDELKNQFNQLLIKAMKNLENNDIILLADVLNFELKEFLLEYSS